MAVTGTVLRFQGGVYRVETPQGTVDASLRGRLKREQRLGERVVVGDRVEVAPGGDGDDAWTIERVHERRTVLARKAPGRAPRAKVIVANVDQVAVVFAAARPEPRLRMLDRFLVIAESAGLDAVVVVNKVDLVGGAEAARETFRPYETAGYRVAYASAAEGVGVEAVREAICGRVSVLAGPSGVGKSSLLNVVQPGLGLRVGEVSRAVQKGQHTTVTAVMIPLECGGYVADTPGLREVGLWGVEAEELDLFFPEMRSLRGACRYAGSCTHVHEPGCAVREAVEAGELDAGRYESYRRLALGEDED